MKYAPSDPVTYKRRNLDSDHCKQRNLDSDQLFSDLYNLLRAYAISAERARFSAEQAHVNFSYKTAANWLDCAI